MALIKYGGGIVQMSGSIAGNTHARNRSGNYMRARTKPVNPQSDRQTTVRARMQFLVQEWKDTLTPAQRTAWGSYADSINWLNALGETINLSGFNMFVRSNMVVLETGEALVAAGPGELSLPAGDPAFSVAISEAGGMTITFDDGFDWCSENDAHLVIDSGTPQNNTRTFFNGPWRYDFHLDGSLAAPIVSPVGPVASNAWTFLEGQRVWCRASILRADGRVSQKFTADSILVAA